MALKMDPAGVETRELRKAIDWRGKQVLEAGCGEGRLTLRLARLGAERIIAFDPDPDLIRKARENLPERYWGKIRYRPGNAEHVKQRARQFDIVVFSWVL
jgi:2-polyprenyl-3-methyl-5-hydroxy-6-metoxy-1,4-benzoquinol methylase